MNTNTPVLPPHNGTLSSNPKSAGEPIEKVDMAQLQTTIEVNGVHINYIKVGIGPHPLILLSGSIGSIDSDQFGPILSKFPSDEFTVVTFDYPGCGKSRPPNRNFSSKQSFFYNDAEFGVELMKKLGFNKFSVLGWCGGGVVGIFMAVKYPDMVQKLILENARAYFNAEDINGYKKLLDMRNCQDSALYQSEEEVYYTECWKDLFKFYIQTYKVDEGNLCVSELSQIKCPTLIICGELDPLVPVQHSYYIHGQIPHSRLIVIPEGKHKLHLRYPEEFLGSVLPFLINP